MNCEKEKSSKLLVNIGTCNLHFVPTASMKGFQEFGEELSNFDIILGHFFLGLPA